MRRLAALCCLVLVACGGGAKKHVEVPEDSDLDNVEESAGLELVIAGPQPALGATDDDLIAAIERTACFGSCPVYNVSVYRTGELRYERRAHVKTIGVVIDRVSPAQLVQIDELFAAHDFEKLAGEYTENARTDNTTVTTWYRLPTGELHAIVHDHGVREIVTRQLRALEDTFDHIVETERFIGTRKERERLRP